MHNANTNILQWDNIEKISDENNKTLKRVIICYTQCYEQI